MDRLYNRFSSFRNPGAEYRGLPFWAWNDEMDNEEIARQIELFREMGFGGYFMHSRVGLKTPYLSPTWFTAIKAGIEAGRKRGMHPWLYDEDRWPSGSAGGLATAEEQYRRMSLRVVENPSEEHWNEVRKSCGFSRLFLCSVEKGVLGDYEAVSSVSAGGQSRNLLMFFTERDKPEPVYNGATYLDTLNREAVGHFIKINYQSYADNIEGSLAGQVKGIFTDEPHYGDSLGDPRCWKLPWTVKLPAEFEEAFGYDLLPYLPELFYSIGVYRVSRHRYLYYELLTRLFVSSFAGQIEEWCTNEGISFTGHVLNEGSLVAQAGSVGSCMRFYEHMHIPGMDLLTEFWREYDTAKQVASAARQTGKKERISELYGCTGWDFPLSGHRAIGDWHAVMGINLRCPHLSLYSLAGERKRDFPASISFQSPWYDQYHLVEDHFARLHSVFAGSREIRQTLVIHPIESMWTMIEKDWKNNWLPAPHILEFEHRWAELRNSMIHNHEDFDLADEEMLSRLGQVIADKQSDPVFKVGEGGYNRIIVPSLLTIRSSTLRLLETWLEAGGELVFTGRIPEYVDAEASGACRKLALKALSSYLPKPGISIKVPGDREENSLLYHLRENDDFYILFVVNSGYIPDHGMDKKVLERIGEYSEVTISLPGYMAGKLYEGDTDSGEIIPVPVIAGTGENMIRTAFAPLQSRLYFIEKGASPAIDPVENESSHFVREVIDCEEWTGRTDSENSLVLDRVDLQFEGNAYRGIDVLDADSLLRKHLGLELRGEQMFQPWAVRDTGRSVPYSLVYLFYLRDKEAAALVEKLVMEQPEAVELFLNGKALKWTDEGWWIDPSFRTTSVPRGCMKKGLNRIEVRGVYRETSDGLEAAYLTGQFGVSIVKGEKPEIIRKPASLSIGDWCLQGYPFYSGSVTYKSLVRKPEAGKGLRAYLSVPDFGGSLIRVSFNDESAQIVYMPPYEIALPDGDEGGEFEISITVVSHRRNLLGPHHFLEKNPVWTGPQVFRPAPQHRVESYQIVPCGLLKKPIWVIRREHKIH
ncbi:MAG: hypothetical protein JXR86_18170 [Spirochaetales bacterium]|nr:hypothetical protein [Spirochaetales bacterium]